jgi:hypothetical protein
MITALLAAAGMVYSTIAKHVAYFMSASTLLLPLVIFIVSSWRTTAGPPELNLDRQSN